MSAEIDHYSWPHSRLGDALGTLARKFELPIQVGDTENWIATNERSIESAVKSLGLEAREIELSYATVELQLKSVGTALLRLPGNGEPRYLVLIGGIQRIRILAPDFSIQGLPIEIIRDELYQVEASLLAEADQLLKDAGISKRRLERVRKAILQERLCATRISGCWTIRLSPGASFWRQLRLAGLSSRLVSFILAYGVQYLLWFWHGGWSG